MTYLKCSAGKTKIYTGTFWLSSLLLTAFFAPIFLIPLALLAMFNFAYLLVHPLPLPIVLSFVAMFTLSLYTVYMNTSHIS